MVRELIVGTIAVLSTLAGSFAATQFGAGAGKSEQAAPEKLEHLALDTVSVPVLRSGKIQGYAVADVVAIVSASILKQHGATIKLYLNEASFRVLYEEQSFNFAELKPAETLAIGHRIVEAANHRLSGDAVKEVVIKGLNYVLAENIRGGNSAP